MKLKTMVSGLVLTCMISILSACSTFATGTGAAYNSGAYDNGVVVEEPTCRYDGRKRYTNKTTGEYYDVSLPANPNNHKFNDWYIRMEPTPFDEGLEQRECRVCRKLETRKLPKVVESKVLASSPLTVQLKSKWVRYKKGKKVHPAIKAVRVKGKKISKKYYTVSYRNDRNVGNGQIIVKGKKKYKGYTTILNYTIYANRAGGIKLRSNAKGQVTVSWTKQNGAVFTVDCGASRSGNVIEKVVTGSSYTFTGLESGKTYYFSVISGTYVNGVYQNGGGVLDKKCIVK